MNRRNQPSHYLLRATWYEVDGSFEDVTELDIPAWDLDYSEYKVRNLTDSEVETRAAARFREQMADMMPVRPKAVELIAIFKEQVLVHHGYDECQAWAAS